MKCDSAGLLPISLNESNQFNTRPRHKYLVPRYNTIGKLCFKARASRVWNALPMAVRVISNKKLFLDKFYDLLIENRLLEH